MESRFDSPKTEIQNRGSVNGNNAQDKSQEEPESFGGCTWKISCEGEKETRVSCVRNTSQKTMEEQGSREGGGGDRE